MDRDTPYARAVRAALEARGWSYTRAALEIAPHVPGESLTRAAVGHWATGQYRPGTGHAAAVERVLGVPARLAYPELWGEDTPTQAAAGD